MIFSNLSNFEIDAYNVTLLIVQQNGWGGIAFNSCNNVAFKGATISYSINTGSQGVITKIGSDPNGNTYYEIMVDAGYTTNLPGGPVIMVGRSNGIRPLTYDIYSQTLEQLGGNMVRAHFGSNILSWPVVTGDCVAYHGGGGGSPNLEVNACVNCLFQDLTFWPNSAWCAMREDASSGDKFYHDTITYGPVPTGAVYPPLITTASGLQCLGDSVGPDIENCLFEGTTDDGFDLRGYGFGDVTAVNGNVITCSVQFHANDAIRMSDSNGGYDDATVTAASGSGPYQLTLNHAPAIHAGAGITCKASNPGLNCPGYKIINTTVRNNRARGILAKGDNGLIQGCTLENNTIAGIQLGVEGGWAFDEPDYVHNVSIFNNTIIGSNDASYYPGHAGGIWITGVGYGAQGNRNITISNNLFEGVYGYNIGIHETQGLVIAGNRFVHAGEYNVGAPNLISFSSVGDVWFSGNSVIDQGPYLTQMVNPGNEAVTKGLPAGILTCPDIDYSGGLTAQGLALNGGAAISGTALVLTDGSGGEARSAFYQSPVNVQSFSTSFSFQLTNAAADGFTFCIQNSGPAAVGLPGGGLGYAGMNNSAAVKFDLYSNGGEGVNSTGFYSGGAMPYTPSIDLSSSNVNLHSGDTINVFITYDGSTLTVTEIDTVTNAQATQNYTVNIPQLVEGNTAYAGFTGGTGGSSAVEKILAWSYSYNSPGIGTGLTGSYFNNQTLSGSATITRLDSQVNFDWGTGSPDPSVAGDHFSARWTGRVQATASGNYIFSTVSDDGVRLWINGARVINNWTDHGPAMDKSGPIFLTAGQMVDITMDYYEDAGGAVAKLYWTPPGPGSVSAPIPQSQLYPSAGLVSGCHLPRGTTVRARQMSGRFGSLDSPRDQCTDLDLVGRCKSTMGCDQ